MTVNDEHLYDVTIYITMKVKVDGIRADSHFHAGENAADIMMDSGIINRGEVTLSTDEGLLDNIRYMDYADEISGYLVDVVGDEEYLQTKFLDPNGEGYRSPSELKEEVIHLSQSVCMLQDAYCELFSSIDNGIDNDTFFKLRERFRNATNAVASKSNYGIFSADAGSLDGDRQAAFDQYNLECAGDVVITAFNRLVNGVIDKEKRDALRSRVIARLSSTHGLSKNVQDYVDKCGSYCPACHSTQIEGGSIDIESTDAIQEKGCNDCEASWNDLYRLVGFNDLKTS